MSRGARRPSDPCGWNDIDGGLCQASVPAGLSWCRAHEQDVVNRRAADLDEALAREAQCCRWRSVELEPPPPWETVLVAVPRDAATVYDGPVAPGYKSSGPEWVLFPFGRTTGVKFWMGLPAPPAQP